MLRGTCWALAISVILWHAGQGGAQDAGEKIGPPAKLPADLGPANGNVVSFEAVRPAYRIYGDADYLYWWVNHAPAPVLLTTAPNNGLNANGLTGGILGEPGTQVALTGRDLGYGGISAFRATAGVNLGDGFWSLEASGLFLPRRSIDFSAVGEPNGAPLITIPFLDAATGRPSSLDVNAQDILFNPYLIGSVAVHSEINLWSLDFNLVAHSIRTAERSVDVIFGFRTLQMSENLAIDQTIAPATEGNISLQFPTAGNGAASYFNIPAGVPVTIADRFSARNNFYGPQVGGRFSWAFGRFGADLNGKVAVGVTRQRVTIDGVSNAAFGVDPVTLGVVSNLSTPGGVFALQNNIGTFTQNQFTVVPEIGLNLKFAVSDFLTVHVGYSALFWSNVARPGAQIDTTLNSKLVPTGALLPTNTSPTGAFIPGAEQGRPYFAFQDRSFWAHGLNFGLEVRY